MTLDLVEIWRRIIVGEKKSWVLFEHGTCVILAQPAGDLAEQATELLKEWGPVYPGTAAADLVVGEVSGAPGWVVTGHHPDVLNYVAPEEVEASPAAPLRIVAGVTGRSKRHRDGRELRVVHVEDRRDVG